jgi:hypothetical protein
MLTAGLAGAAVCAGIGTALLVAAPGMPVGERAAARVIADVAFALGALAGVPAALSWLSRYGQPMTPRAFGAVFGTGVIATIGLFVLIGH